MHQALATPHVADIFLVQSKTQIQCHIIFRSFPHGHCTHTSYRMLYAIQVVGGHPTVGGI